MKTNLLTPEEQDKATEAIAVLLLQAHRRSVARRISQNVKKRVLAQLEKKQQEGG